MPRQLSETATPATIAATRHHDVRIATPIRARVDVPNMMTKAVNSTIPVMPESFVGEASPITPTSAIRPVSVVESANTTTSKVRSPGDATEATPGGCIP
jgi:hypothetical protein